MSQIKLSGNLTKDPSFFHNENSSDAVMFTVAENVDKDTEYAKTYFHSVKVRGAKAKTVSAALAKGALVRIEGRLESYTKADVKDTKGYDVVFWNITAFVIDVYDRETSGWKSVIKSEPKADKPKVEDEAGETKPKADKPKVEAAPDDDNDEF